MSHPWIGKETGPLDDAALLHPTGNGTSLVFTLDVITPIVDDPVAFGRIAAANSLSDVYAMGGTPQVALSFVGMPGSLGLDMLADVMKGTSEKAQEANAAIVGGHTIKDTEPKCGLVVIGSVPTDKVWTHKGAKAGQALILTKPLGTGVIAQANRAGKAPEESLQAAVHYMEMLNAKACEVGKKHGVTAATDVTGFGFLGHLQHIVGASGVSAKIHVDKVPLLPGALELARQDFIPGGTRRNAAYVQSHIIGADDIETAKHLLLADAQTSGGLLLVLPVDEVDAVLNELPGSVCIGQIEDGTPGSIQLVS